MYAEEAVPPAVIELGADGARFQPHKHVADNASRLKMLRPESFPVASNLPAQGVPLQPSWIHVAPLYLEYEVDAHRRLPITPPSGLELELEEVACAQGIIGAAEITSEMDALAVAVLDGLAQPARVVVLQPTAAVSGSVLLRVRLILA